MLNLRLVEPELIVDIAGLPELRHAAVADGALVLGACVTHADIEDGRVPDVTRGAMQRVASTIAYRAVRNRGTIGGSLSHADPSADWVTALVALGASIVLEGQGSRRMLAVEDFILGALQSALAPGEMLTAVRIPPMAPSARWGFVKSCRKAGEFAEAMAAVLVDPETGGVRIVIGALEAAPMIIGDAAHLFGDRIGADFLAHFDARAADAALAKAGLADPVDRHIRVGVLHKAIQDAAR